MARLLLAILLAAALLPPSLAIDCGMPPEPLNASVPNVLLIGDSISMGTAGTDAKGTPLGYGWGVQAMLEGDDVAKVQVGARAKNSSPMDLCKPNIQLLVCLHKSNIKHSIMAAGSLVGKRGQPPRPCRV